MQAIEFRTAHFSLLRDKISSAALATLCFVYYASAMTYFRFSVLETLVCIGNNFFILSYVIKF